ncbi:amidophosphoribosyltransferase [Rheinheimera salexigens]|uniref:Amidophosphoribosyltransferase n=1 Tax=Rheinheimera salexigens TaxID=1628148 RepID=A0A1E7Q9P6_9GAMM|nr:amidophosphoribosyltransferase [Rheinheimera salexigens]
MTNIIPSLRHYWHLLLPSCCLWCSLPVQHAQQQLCTCCQQALPSLPYPLCHYNLLWLPVVSKSIKKPLFQQLLALSYYHHPYQHWIQQWKFFANHAAGELLQQQFISLLSRYAKHTIALPQAILYVPMHPSRQRKRGFNQAEILAKAAAKQLKLPLLNVLQRQHKNPAQVGLNRKQRQRNLKQAFSLQTTAALPSHVALIDDVITTGATANELCRLLKRNGVSHISLWTLAVTVLD